ncbi:MAG: hypothetical protein KC431_17930, partial [Myxococcales bacterium]|nr:hypothetical protein [Myxococcales bacterium]
LLGLALALLSLGCTHTDEPSEQPAADAAAPAKTAEAAARSARGIDTQAEDHAGARDIVIAVATVDTVDIGPCERMCGQVGDCLLTEGQRGAEASSLELSCLDLCLAVDPESRAGQTFRSCGAQTQACGEVLGCTRSNWQAADAARRKAPEQPRGPVAVADPCRETCEGLYSCMYFDTPRSADFDGRGDPQFISAVEDCVAGCDPKDRYIEQFAACTAVVECMEQWECSARIHDS